MKKALVIILSIFIISNFLFFFSINALAYNFQQDSGLLNTGKGAGFSEAANPTAAKTIPERIGEVISIILTFLGVIFLILIIYGGYLWMMARGNDEEVKKARKIIVNALIGLIVVLISYAVTYAISFDYLPV